MTNHRQKTPSSSGNWVRAVIRTVDAAGFDGRRTALDAGVPGRVLRDATVRVPQEIMTRFWARAVEVTGNPAIGLSVPVRTSPSTFGAFAYAVLASPDLGSLLSRIARFHTAVSDALDVAYVVSGDRGWLEFDTSGPVPPPYEAMDMATALLTNTVRFVSGTCRIVPLVTELQRPRPDDVARYEKVLHGPVKFAAKRVRVVYARRDLERQLPDGNAELARMNDTIVADHLAAIEAGSWSASVARTIVEACPDPPNEQEVARRLGVSKSHLHRLLSAEGNSYRRVLDRERESLARQQLEKGRYSIKELAFLLGFSDATTFTRAFKRWTGESPRRFADRVHRG